MWFEIIVFVIICALIKIYAKLTAGKCEMPKDLHGKVFVITGGNRGIGLQTWRELALKGASCHVFCRNMVTQQRAWYNVGEMKRAGLKVDVDIYLMDMASQESIRTSVASFLDTYKGKIDVLINNAGLGWLGERSETVDGLETTFATNHLGGFLLTHLLMPRLLLSDSPRIVNLTSLAHFFTRSGDFITDLNSTKSYNKHAVYGFTKLCNILFTRQLQARLGGKGVNSYAVHPGSVSTDLFRHMAFYEKAGMAFVGLFMKTPLEGAQTSLYCALSDNAVPGEYHWDCGVGKSSALSKDVQLAEKLWVESEKMVKLSDAEKI